MTPVGRPWTQEFPLAARITPWGVSPMRELAIVAVELCEEAIDDIMAGRDPMVVLEVLREVLIVVELLG